VFFDARQKKNLSLHKYLFTNFTKA